MKQIAFLSLCLAAGFFCSYAAETFLATPIRKRTVGQLKQEIVEILGVYLQQTSKLIEKCAYNQQHICSCIKQLAEGEAQSYLSKASRTELQASLEKLQKLKKNQDKQLAELSQTIEFFTNGCAVSVQTAK